MTELTEAEKAKARADWLRNPRNIGIFGLISRVISNKYPASMPSWMLPKDD